VAYSGVKSPFAFLANALGKTNGSPTPSSSALQVPTKSVFSQGSSETAFEGNLQTLESLSKDKEDASHKPGEEVVVVSEISSQPKQVTLKALPEAELLTGEENENLIGKLKGVRLFKVKGTKVDRSLVGEIKLLEDKSTRARRLGEVFSANATPSVMLKSVFSVPAWCGRRKARTECTHSDTSRFQSLALVVRCSKP